MNQIIVLFILISLIVSIYQKNNTYNNFIEGVKNGIKIFITIFPAIFSMILLSQFLNDIFENSQIQLNFPLNILPLMLVRPFSGAAAMGVLINIISSYGVDSKEGIFSSIIMGGSETTFYAINTYYSIVKHKPEKKLYIAAILADIALYISAFIAVKIIF